MKSDQKGMYYVSGIPVPETPAPGADPPPWGKTRVIGGRKPRVDGYERVSGAAVYPSDVILPGMLHGAILRSPHPHARIRKFDSGRAQRLPGVRAVLGPDSPEAEIKWPYDDKYQVNLLETHCRFEGETIAAVAAETPCQAWDAIRAIRVEYEVLPFVADETKALEEGAPQVHENGNEHQTGIHERGDVAKGFAEADVVLEQEYRTGCEIHTPLELHGCVARWDGDRLTIWESTQGVYAVQSQVAEILRLPLARVRVVGHYLGGGFGSKLKPGKYTIIAALLARKTGRPVRLFLTREETFLDAGNRPPAHMTLKAGVKKDGTLTALSFSCLGTGGAFPAGGTALVDWLVRDLYTCPNVYTRDTDVFINAGMSRPFRAPGHPQGAWALEQMMDALAREIGMDPVELRLRNIPFFSQARKGNPPYTTSGLRACLETGAREFGWQEALRNAEGFNRRSAYRKRGVGVASCLWFAGGGDPPSTVILKLFADGSLNLNMGASDIGTGTKTVMAMVAAEELGIGTEVIQIENADTGTTQYATPSGGSKTVPTEAPAVRAAAVKVKQQLLEMASHDLQETVFNLDFLGSEIAVRNDPQKRIRVTDIKKLKERGLIVGIGYRGPNPAHKVVCPFCAQFCEVEVNLLTGEVQVLRFLSTNDSGRVMDRLTFDSQVFGGITMGIGLALTECRVLDRRGTGKMLNRNWHDYKLPTSLDVSLDMISVPVELEDPEANSTGAKGLGEPVTIPTAAAIANAICHAVGVRVTETPINPVTLNRILGTTQQENA